MKVGLRSKIFNGLDIIRGHIEGMFTVSSTPFGAPLGDKQIVVKRNVDWRRKPGQKRRPMEVFKEEFPKIAANLEKAQAKVRAIPKSDREGVAEVILEDGSRTLMPRVSAELLTRENPRVKIVRTAKTVKQIAAAA